ncbi:zinc-binding dehydrogenase [Goodfellowiella coeruleoviolacea]|uniref:Alcohol dehydrogenase n=1 Tax=Goodfellowiella coeruleoviolacea TaxID=334858 RepID=A0AAE3KCY0_9PSEU|nr:zinc-binding dehydrogenase [Goodfellowiella coeruleoviolacea]MCP2163401.1 alcohol dehydrogenase [Goodfellowiella coeruleoviolacea]
MRAWVLDRAGDEVRCAEVAEPELRGGGVVISTLAVHVPAYAAEVVSGERNYSFPTPLILGPGGIGRVESVAPDVFNVRPGDIVLNTSLLDAGRVDEPQEILVGWTGVDWRGAPSADTRAMQTAWRDGGCAERAVCPKESLIRLPGAEHYPNPAKLAFLGWLSVAAEGLRRAEQRAGQVVTVLGATGQMGAAAVLVALAQGAARVVAVGRNRDVLDRLTELDGRVAAVALTGQRAEDAAAITEAGGGSDVVVDALGAVPSAEPTLAGYDSLRPGGCLVLIGGVRQDLVFPYGQLMRRRQTIRGSWMAEPATALAVWRMVAAGSIDLDAVDVHPVGLDDPAGAFRQAAQTSGLRFVALVPGA